MAAMAAPPPLGGGHMGSSSPFFTKKSFSVLFAKPSSLETRQVQATLAKHRGEPAIVFNAKDISAIASSFRFSLVSKFSKGWPTLPDLRKFFLSLDLRDSVAVGLLDFRHVLLKFNSEADFLRVWVRNIWYVYGCPMRVFK